MKRAKVKRQSYTVKYKRAILKEASACKVRGEVSKLLRREGLYASNLTRWRRAFGRKTKINRKPQEVFQPKNFTSPTFRNDIDTVLSEIRRLVLSFVGYSPLPATKKGKKRR